MIGIRLLRPAVVVALLGVAGCEHVGVFEPFREVSCFEAAKVSLTDAVAAAEAGGGTALDADYRQDEEMGCLQNDPGAYDVTILAGGRISAVSIDARSGQVGPRQEQGVMNALFGGGGQFEGSAADMARMVPGFSRNISEGIEVAERGGGKAMSAWIEAKDGKPGYTVKVVANGRVRVLWVDGT